MSRTTISNISNKEAIRLATDISKLFKTVYKKMPGKKIQINELHVTTPEHKRKIYKMDDYKNLRKVFSYLFANINNKTFTQRKYNIYAFELLWIILDALERDNYKGNLYKKKKLFPNEDVNNNIVNLIKFGKYTFNIPKKYKYVFDIQGYGLAKLNII